MLETSGERERNHHDRNLSPQSLTHSRHSPGQNLRDLSPLLSEPPPDPHSLFGIGDLLGHNHSTSAGSLHGKSNCFLVHTQWFVNFWSQGTIPLYSLIILKCTNLPTNVMSFT
jgi:hypothetical protein